MVIRRELQVNIENNLFKGKAIVIYGARQVGKTTLLRALMSARQEPQVYFNCDERDDREKLTNTTSTELRAAIGAAKIIFIDEAQRVPNIGLTIKLLTDNLPDRQVVATGSSSFELANSIREPLTGRAYEYMLYPLSYRELTGATDKREQERLLEIRLLYGMYPEVALRPAEAQRHLEGLTKAYLFKDVLEWQTIKSPEVLEKLLEALALQIGQEVSYNELSRLVGLDKVTVARYIRLLEQAYIIFRLRPFHRKARQELRKLRKIYFYDTGIRNAIIRNFNPLSRRQDVGQLWENWLISERQKSLHNREITPLTYFWRTHTSREIDYLEEEAGQLKAFELKWGSDKEARFPKAFWEAYPNSLLTTVNRSNFGDFLLV